MALLRILSTFLLILSVSTAQTGGFAGGTHDPDNDGVGRNLVESKEQSLRPISRSFQESSEARSDKEESQASSQVPQKPQARTFSSFFGSGGENEEVGDEEKDSDGTAVPIIVDTDLLKKHPLWRFHKYQGINIQAVPISTIHSSPPEIYGPPEVSHVPETYGPPEILTPEQPLHTYGPPELSNSETEDDSEVASVDNLIELLNSLSPENWQALTSLASHIQRQPKSYPASTYGPPSVQLEVPDSDLPSIRSLITLLPPENTSSGSGSFISRLRSLFSRSPAFLTSLLNRLNILNSSNSGESAGASQRSFNSNNFNLIPINDDNKLHFKHRGNYTTKDGSGNNDLGAGYYLTSGDFDTRSDKGIIKKGIIKKPLKLGKKLKKVGVKKAVGLLKLKKKGNLKLKSKLKKNLKLKPHVIKKLVKLSKLGLKKGKPIKKGIFKKPPALKVLATKLKLLSKLSGFPKKKGGLLSVKSKIPLKIKLLKVPLKIKGSILSKLGKLGKFGITKVFIPLKLGILSKKLGLTVEGLKKLLALKLKVGASSKAAVLRGLIKLKTEKGKSFLKLFTNFFLGTGTASETGQFNLLRLPALRPIQLSSNYGLKETHTSEPYVTEYSNSLPLPSTYGPPDDVAQYPQTYGVPVNPPEEPVYPPPIITPTYDPQVQLASATPYEIPQVTSFTPSYPLSEHYNLYETPSFSFTNSAQYPRAAVNSYGQATTPYEAVPPEISIASNFKTDSQNQIYDEGAHVSDINPDIEIEPSNHIYSEPTHSYATDSGFGTEFQNQFYKESKPTLETDPFLNQDIYLVPEEANFQNKVTSQSVPDQGGQYPITSRSDNLIPSHEIHPNENENFRPSSLSAATGAGYSRVVFQRSNRELKSNGQVRHQEKQNLLATSASATRRSNGDQKDVGDSRSSVHSMLLVPSETSSLPNEKEAS